MFNQLSAVQRAYAYLQLAKRFLLQCETQVRCITCYVQLSLDVLSSASITRCILWLCFGK